jgi:hypothetical protein
MAPSGITANASIDTSSSSSEDDAGIRWISALSELESVINSVRIRNSGRGNGSSRGSYEPSGVYKSSGKYPVKFPMRDNEVSTWLTSAPGIAARATHCVDEIPLLLVYYHGMFIFNTFDHQSLRLLD